MHRNLIDYLPPVLKDFQEIKTIMQAQQEQVSGLWDGLSDVLNDQFVTQAGENGISRWEKILGISPKGTDTLDLRRFRILSRLSEQNPYTVASLNQQMAALWGEEGYRLTVLSDTYTLKVMVELAAKGKFDEVKSLLLRMAPANLIIDLSLLYNQYLTLAGFTNQQLTAYTYEQLRNEVIT